MLSSASMLYSAPPVEALDDFGSTLASADPSVSAYEGRTQVGSCMSEKGRLIYRGLVETSRASKSGQCLSYVVSSF